MKIAIDVSHYNKLSWFGVVTRGLVDALMELDTKNTYYFVTNVKINDQYLQNFNNFPNGKLIVYESNYISYKFFGVTKILKEHDVDLYISLDQQLPLRKVCKYYCVSHDILVKILWRWKLFKELLVWNLKFKDFIYYFMPFEEYSYHLADKIFTPSKNTKKDLIEKLWIHQNNIIVMHRWMDHLQETSQYAWNKKNYILFPFPNNPTWFYLELANKIIESWLSDSVIVLKPTWKVNELSNNKIKIITDRISDLELIELYQNAKLSIYISDYDWFWFPPLESIFYGTPVIYKDHSCMDEVVWRWGIKVKDFDIEEFINEIRKFNDIDYYKDQQTRWMDWINQYQWKNTAQILLDNL